MEGKYQTEGREARGPRASKDKKQNKHGSHCPKPCHFPPLQDMGTQHQGNYAQTDFWQSLPSAGTDRTRRWSIGSKARGSRRGNNETLSWGLQTLIGGAFSHSVSLLRQVEAFPKQRAQVTHFLETLNKASLGKSV